VAGPALPAWPSPSPSVSPSPSPGAPAYPPWGWPGYLADRGISPFWAVEAGSMLIPSLIGCYAGYERGATIPDRAAAEEG